MDNYKEEILSSIQNLNLKEEIKLIDIPKLDLYIDQVITLFEIGLSGNKRNEDDKILTKTMINNYSKDKILMPAKNKKYSRDHIIMMILIYNLKQGLPISDIKNVLSKLVENYTDDANTSELTKLYESFLNIKDVETDNFNNRIQEDLDLILDKSCDLNGNEDSHYYKILLTILMLINQSNIYKRLAENIIDTYFKE